MVTSLALPSFLVKQETHQTDTTEYAMLGDVVEIHYGWSTLIGTVVEGDPWLDSFGQTWFRVVGVANLHTTSIWVNDEATIRIIERA
jgi:hypothetical protein